MDHIPLFSSRIRWASLGALLLLTATVPLGCSSSTTAPLPGPTPGTGEPWAQYATPEDAGFSSEVLEEARQFAESIQSGAVMIVHKGSVVAAWGDVKRKFRCHSVRKSFLSSLYGTAVARGDLALESTLAELGIDDLEPLSEIEKTAQVRDLLRTSSGVYHPAAKESPDVAQHRPARGSHAPGTHFWYNNWDFNTSCAIYEQATGEGIFEAFRDQIAEPIGMQDFTLADTFYEYVRNNSNYPAYAFRMSTRDMAKFGLLFLQEGLWGGRAVIQKEWVQESTSAQATVQEGTDYGYMWWVYPQGGTDHLPEYRVFTATGTGGQHILVVPEADVVIVHRGDTDFGAGVPGSRVWQLETMILSALVSVPKEDPKLVSFESTPWSASLPPLDLPTAIELDRETLDRYVGEYRVVDEGVSVFLRRHEDVLVGVIPGFTDEFDIFPESKSSFFPGLDRAVIEFHFENGNENGTIIGLTLDLADGLYRADKVS